MADDRSSLNTHDLVFWVTELQAGRPAAAEPIFRKIMARVERLARATFKKFPRVGRFVDADDVVQSSLIRLLAAFREVRPASRRHFYSLANELIRRELLDLVRHYYGPHGDGTNQTELTVGEGPGEVPAADHAGPTEAERLASFHETIAGLPAEEQEVIGLSYYHGWSQAEIAGLLQVSVRTVQRWLDSALARLRQAGPPTA